MTNKSWNNFVKTGLVDKTGGFIYRKVTSVYKYRSTINMGLFLVHNHKKDDNERKRNYFNSGRKIRDGTG